MLAIGRALLRQPEFLILDEPSEGLAPVIVQHLVETLKKISSMGVKMLLVEQNLQVAVAIAPRILVMVSGEIALDIESAKLIADEKLKSQFLGISH
jgi:branched-chain amino acid transport system ATP-binding protein